MTRRPTATEIPWPGTCHPKYERDAEFVRRLMAEGRRHVVLMHIDDTSPDFSLTTYPDLTVRQVVLDVRRARGRAPYVGDPLEYHWSAAVDSEGQGVASGVRVQFLFGPNGDRW